MPQWLGRFLPVTKNDLTMLEDKIMSAISDFITVVNTGFTKLGDDLTGVKAKLGVVVDGIAKLDDLITKLQNSPGGITPQDQALLDAAQAQVQSLVTQADDVAAAADAINTTPPPPPV
jgi:uncharacterized phage infection (PIP) family protein YhgE